MTDLVSKQLSAGLVIATDLRTRNVVTYHPDNVRQAPFIQTQYAWMVQVLTFAR
jgi:hypothetical protein